jgi:hypothetical protein
MMSKHVIGAKPVIRTISPRIVKLSIVVPAMFSKYARASCDRLDVQHDDECAERRSPSASIASAQRRAALRSARCDAALPSMDQQRNSHVESGPLREPVGALGSSCVHTDRTAKTPHRPDVLG